MKNESSQTDFIIEYEERGTDCIRFPSKGIQTDSLHKLDKEYLASIRISHETIDLIIEALQDAEAEEEFFYELDEFKKDEKISLIEFRNAIIPMPERVPIIGLVLGSNLKVAVLFGEARHDSWCLHSNLGRIIIYRKLRVTSSIYLPCCPTKAVFAPQNQIIIASASGEIFLCFEGEIIWHSSTIHTKCITSMCWVSHNLLLTAGMDGCITLFTLKTNSLEVNKSIKLTFNHLPRALRKSNVFDNERSTGIIALCKFRTQIFVAGETGAIWTLNTNDLTVSQCGFELNGIENFIFISEESRDFESEYFIIQTPLGEFRKKIYKSVSNSTSLFQSESSDAFCYKRNLFIFLNKGEINGIDLKTNKIIMRHDSIELPNFSKIALNDDETLLVGITSDYKLHFYNFSCDF